MPCNHHFRYAKGLFTLYFFKSHHQNAVLFYSFMYVMGQYKQTLLHENTIDIVYVGLLANVNLRPLTLTRI